MFYRPTKLLPRTFSKEKRTLIGVRYSSYFFFLLFTLQLKINLITSGFWVRSSMLFSEVMVFITSNLSARRYRALRFSCAPSPGVSRGVTDLSSFPLSPSVPFDPGRLLQPTGPYTGPGRRRVWIIFIDLYF